MINTFSVVISPSNVPATLFNMVGERNCPRLIAQVKTAEAIAQDVVSAAFATATIPVGIKIPCEKPQSNAPINNICNLDGNRSRKHTPREKLSIAAESVSFPVLFVTDPRINPATICIPEKAPVKIPDTVLFPSNAPLRCIAILVENVIRKKNSRKPKTEVIHTSLFSRIVPAFRSFLFFSGRQIQGHSASLPDGIPQSRPFLLLS